MWRRAVRTKYTYVLISIVTAFASLSQAPAALAACATNTATLGSVTGTFTIAKDATYRVWSRMSVPDTTNNSFTLEIDGTKCNITVGDTATSLNTWTWIDYQNGTTSSKIDIALTAGTHTYTLYGREPNVKVDRIIFSPTTTCTPSVYGDNCLTAPDTQAPSVPTNLSNPSKTTTTATLNWTASSDDTAVTAYKVYRGGVLVATVAAPAVTVTDTGLTAATSYTYQVSAVDAANNESAKTAALTVLTALAPPPADTQAPSVPSNVTVSSKTTASVTLTWSASSDNKAVTGYKVFRNGTLVSSVSPTASPTFTDNGLSSATTYTYQISAYDAANNESAKSASLAATTNTPTTPKTGDLNNDGKVNYVDLAVMLQNYNKSTASGDMNSDGKVNYIDLGILLGNYGK